jgi:hypothetical protein
MNKKSRYIAVFDHKNAFESFCHQLLKKNLEKLEKSIWLRNLIMDSYHGTIVRIWGEGRASRTIEIRKDIKH